MKPPYIVFCSLLVFVAGTAGSEDARSKLRSFTKPNLLLITLDTTRADHLGCYGRKEAKTPVLDSLASQGALFEEAHSHVPLTLPSHATLLTGQLPSTLNLRINGLRLKDGVGTLATHLKAAGYWTGAVVATAVLKREYGLSRDFVAYDDRMTLVPSGEGIPEERRAEEVTEAALALVNGVRAPMFLWVHYYDPHYEYRPPAPYRNAFSRAPYDGEIAYMDASIGQLLNGLRVKGLLKNTLIVVAGDHGEALMEHAERQHGIFLYEYALHVPLLLVWESRIRPGSRIRDVCGLADVAPTVLDLMGERPLTKTDGVSLRPLLEGRGLAPRTLYAESYHAFFSYGWAPLRAIVTDRWKFIEAPRPELYEWRVSEEDNLYAEGRPEVRTARRTLQRHSPGSLAETALSENYLQGNPASEETRRRLTSLGYLSGDRAKSDTRGLDPKDAIGIEEDLRRVKESLDGRDVQKAIEMLRSVLRRNPQNVSALSMLGLAYLNTGNAERAKGYFQEAIRLRPELKAARLNLGMACERTGEIDLAVGEYKTALVISPGYAEAATKLARIYRSGDLLAQCRRVLESTLIAGGESADLYLELGLLESDESHWEKARFAFTKVVSLDPARDGAYAHLGNIAYRQGRIDESIYHYQRAVRIAPANARYLTTLGTLFLDGKDDASQALVYYRRALAADPYGPEAKILKNRIQKLEAP